MKPHKRNDIEADELAYLRRHVQRPHPRGPGRRSWITETGAAQTQFFALFSTARRAVSAVRGLSANGLARPIARGDQRIG
jgi:hypothetical protein